MPFRGLKGCNLQGCPQSKGKERREGRKEGEILPHFFLKLQLLNHVFNDVKVLWNTLGIISVGS